MSALSPLRLALVAALAAGCAADKGAADSAADADADTDADADADSGADSGDTGADHPFDSAPQDPYLVDGVEAPALASGAEMLLFVNGRASDATTNHTTNRVEESRILGPEVYLYDPAQPGRLHVLGRPDWGRVDGYQGAERLKMGIYEVAWSPDHGLYSVEIDPYNDEWLLDHWQVEDWTGGVDFATAVYGVPVDADEHHSLYWEYGIEALEFVDGRLLAGSHADYESDDGGEVYAFDMDLPPAYDPAQPEGDLFYMADAPAGPLFELPHALQFAGDLTQASGVGLAVIDASDSAVIPDDQNQLYACDWSAISCQPVGDATIPLSADDQTIEGLAEIGGVVYGVTVDAQVLALDPATGEASLHDDLGPLFRDREGQVRVRGGTRVVLP